MQATTLVVLVLCIFCIALLVEADLGCPEDNLRCNRECGEHGGSCTGGSPSQCACIGF